MSTSDGPAPAPGEAPPSAPSPFERARAWHAEGQSRADIARRLAGELDEDSLKVVLNTLPGAPLPHALPEARFDTSTNALAPGALSFLDFGLSGERRIVAGYWLALGSLLLAPPLVVWVLDFAGVLPPLPGQVGFALGTAFVLGALASLLGLLRLLGR